MGLDTQSIRDLIALSQNGEVILKDYNNYINALETIISKNIFNANSQPVQVDLILKQLSKKLANRENTIKKKTDNEVNQELLNSEILSTLLELKKDIHSIKQVGTPVYVQPAQSVQQDNTNVSALERVFVNPIDESKVDSIKSSVSIESKVGDNIGDKLNKLKNFKKS